MYITLYIVTGVWDIQILLVATAGGTTENLMYTIGFRFILDAPTNAKKN